MSGASDRELFGAPAEIRVLHVDDDPEFADLTASFLDNSETAFDVTISTDPTDALDLFRGAAFDCVVSDYDMPGLSGLELLAEIREIDPDVPFVLFTGKGSEEIASRAISSGVTDYLQKSVGTDQYTVLANRIENAVETYRSQEALAASQERLSRFIEQSPLGTIEYDETFTIVRVNEAAGEITGYDPEELVGGTWLPIVPEDERRHVAAVERQLLSDRGGYRSVNEIVTKGGERRWATWHNRVVTDDDGDVITIFSQFEDVTEDYERKQKLERHDVFRSILLEMLPVGVLAENADRRVIRVNDRLLDLFGVPDSRETVVGTDCETLLGEISDRFADPQAFLDRTEHLIDDREPVEVEELSLADGGAVERSYRPISLPNGPGHLWVYYDVSDIRERERQLEALNETAQELMAATTREAVAEIGVDAADTVLGLEANAIHFFEPDTGLVPVAATDTVEELVGDIPTFAGDDSIAWRAYQAGEPISIDDVRSDPDNYNPETPIRSELYLPLGDDGILIAGSPGVGVFDRSDEVLGEILATTLVTALDQVGRTEQLREREHRLTRQNARLEEFAAVVSHDLRNPLRVAEGRLTLAREEADSDHLRGVSDAHDRMAELIDELLTLARDYDDEIDPAPVDLEALVRGCWSNVDTGHGRVVVRTDRRIRADEARLKRLVENLLRNAVEHGSTSSRTESGDAVEHSSTSPRSHARGDAVEHSSTSNRAGPDDAVEHSSTSPQSQAPEDSVEHSSTGSRTESDDAAEHAPETPDTDDSKVTITVGELPDGFYVEDDGPGIPPEERDSIFEYGYSTTPGGTGLGLAIVEQCVAAHGWAVDVAEGADGGARFEVTRVEFVEKS